MSTTPLPLDPNVPEPQETTPAPQGNEWWNEPEPTPAPQAPPPPTPEYFLRAETGTVYKTAEDAARGVAEKDRVIAQQKVDLERAQQILAAQGVHLGTQTPSPQAQQHGLVQKLETAVKQGDMSFDEAMAAFTKQQFQNEFQSFQPLVEYATMNRAVEQAATQYDPNIPAFVRSPAYAKTLDKWPALKTAIQTATSQPHQRTGDGRSFADLVPELLASVFQIAKAAAPAAAPSQRTPQQSSTPPIYTGPDASQAPAPSQYGFTRMRNPEQEAWDSIADFSLTK